MLPFKLFLLLGAGMLTHGIPSAAHGATNDTTGGTGGVPETSVQPSLRGSNELNASRDELDSWEPPSWILKNYPYYLTGYDYDGRPIWIAEWGKFDMRKLVESGEENQKLFTKYVEKTVRVIMNSTHIPSNPSNEINFILDFDGLRIEQFASIPTVRYVIGLGLQHRSLIEVGGVSRVIIINANFVTDTFIRLSKTVFGKLFEIVEVYGSNKSVWIPQLLRIFPRDQLPEWYGGEKGHKPVLIYG